MICNIDGHFQDMMVLFQELLLYMFGSGKFEEKLEVEKRENVKENF